MNSHVWQVTYRLGSESVYFPGRKRTGVFQRPVIHKDVACCLPAAFASRICLLTNFPSKYKVVRAVEQGFRNTCLYTLRCVIRYR